MHQAICDQLSADSIITHRVIIVIDFAFENLYALHGCNRFVKGLPGAETLCYNENSRCKCV